MTYHGDIALGNTIDFKFTTINPATGVPITLAGTPVISAYPDNSVTELTAGITLTVNFDGRTGLHNIRIIATSGNGYTAGSNYDVVITTGTVNGVSAVGYIVGAFSIEARSALRPATAGRTVVVDTAGLVDANAVKVGPTGSGTAQTAGDVIGDTNDIQARLPTVLVSGRMDASVGSVANDAITAAAIATNAIDADALAEDAANEIADATLKRDWTAVSGEAARSVLNALRKLRNKVGISGATLTVRKEDDLTSAYTQAIVTDAAQEPIKDIG